VSDFRDAGTHKYDKPTYLKDIPYSTLLVYKNKAAFDKRNATVDEGKEDTLEEGSFINGLGETEEEAILVFVPSLAGSSFRVDEMEGNSSLSIFDSSCAFVNTKNDGVSHRQKQKQ
jgi:hypothetical protein